MQKNRSILVVIGVAVLVIFGGLFYWSKSQLIENKANIPRIENAEYNQVIDPGNFVSNVKNPYFTLKPGTKFRYENTTEEGTVRIEVEVLSETRQVMGVTTAVVRDRVFLNDELIEDTRDWYAQDKEGNVWYFGEDVSNYEGGVLKNHQGAWEAGVDGALPGIIMPASPRVGHSYRQEYYKGEAEDWGEVVALDQEVTIPYGTFTNCLQTKDWSALESSVVEYKYYCSDVSFVVLEKQVAGQEKVELVSVSTVQ